MAMVHAQLVIIQLNKDGEDLPTDSSWLTNVKIGVDGAKKEEITQLLEKHKKCFPKQLPMRLPPERPVSHEITVEQGSAPPSRPPYHLSESELDELRQPPPPLEAILVIFRRRALIFFVWKLLEKNEKWHHLCAHAQWWSPWRS